jgi:hypothetical protein
VPPGLNLPVLYRRSHVAPGFASVTQRYGAGSSHECSLPSVGVT